MARKALPRRVLALIRRIENGSLRHSKTPPQHARIKKLPRKGPHTKIPFLDLATGIKKLPSPLQRGLLELAKSGSTMKPRNFSEGEGRVWYRSSGYRNAGRRSRDIMPEPKQSQCGAEARLGIVKKANLTALCRTSGLATSDSSIPGRLAWAPAARNSVLLRISRSAAAQKSCSWVLQAAVLHRSRKPRRRSGFLPRPRNDESRPKEPGLGASQWRGQRRDISALRSQGNWASSKAMAWAAVGSGGSPGAGAGGGALASRARRARRLRP